MTVVVDEVNGAFDLTLKLQGLDGVKGMRIAQGGDGVRVLVSIESPRQVHAWAKQMGVQAQTQEPTQAGGTTWWYRYTVASLRRDGLYVQVTAVQMALELDAAAMTEPVIP